MARLNISRLWSSVSAIWFVIETGTVAVTQQGCGPDQASRQHDRAGVG